MALEEKWNMVKPLSKQPEGEHLIYRETVTPECFAQLSFQLTMFHSLKVLYELQNAQEML